MRPEHSIRDVARLMREENVGIVPVTDSGGRLLGLVMGRKQVRRLPVVERDNRLVGIIAMADIATRADQDEELQEALERISQRRSFWSRLG